MSVDPSYYVDRFDLLEDRIKQSGFISYVFPEFPDRSDYIDIFNGLSPIRVDDNQGKVRDQTKAEVWNTLYNGNNILEAWASYQEAWMVETLTSTSAHNVFLFSPGENDYYVVFGDPSNVRERCGFGEIRRDEFLRYIEEHPWAETRETLSKISKRLIIS